MSEAETAHSRALVLASGHSHCASAWGCRACTEYSVRNEYNNNLEAGQRISLQGVGCAEAIVMLTLEV